MGRRGPNFPPNLAEHPPFHEWIRLTVEREIEDGHRIDPTVEAISRAPSRFCKKHRSMYAFGYHFRVRSAESHLRTCDSGIAATFTRPCRSGIRDRNVIIAAVEYVGHLDEILEVDYGAVRQTVLIGTWVKANYRGPSATIKKG